MVEFQASWHIPLLGGSRLLGQRAVLTKGEEASTACAGLSLGTLPCSPPPPSAGVPAGWGPASTLYNPVRPLGVGSLGRGQASSPARLAHRRAPWDPW